MKISNYSEMLFSLLEREDGCVVLLKGPWGVGKTYFWNSFAETKLKKGKHAYVSLFGKNDIKSIESEALIQIFSRNKYIEWFSDTVKQLKGNIKEKIDGVDVNFGLTGSTVGLVLSLLKAKTLKDNILCIDDFERKSDSLKIVDVIGFASILSERFNCKVVLIMDETKINDKHKFDKYIEYKEKLINFEIDFDPDHSEIVNSLLSGLSQKYKPGVINAINYAHEQNLRTIKKIIDRLNFLEKITGGKFDTALCERLGFDVSLLAMVYCTLGKDGLHNISSLGFNDANKKAELGEEKFNKVRDCRSKISGKVSIYSDIHKVLWNFIQTLSINKDEISAIIKLEKDQLANNLISEDVFNMIDRFTYDLTYSADMYRNDVMEILNDNKNELIGIFSLENYLYIINSIEQTTDDHSIIKKFNHEVLEAFVIEKVKSITSYEMYKRTKNNNIIEYICNNYSAIKNKYISEIKIVEKRLSQTKNILELLKKLPSAGGWNPEDENILDSLPTSYLIDNIQKNPDFFKALVNFLKWRQSFHPNSSFVQIYNKATAAIRGMASSELSGFRYYRISRFLNL
ncbi:MAG: hypothetical protein HY915_02445 [Desulfovibrio sp.]|nr:hypothetical protein [Desulfovibrio sp.]